MIDQLAVPELRFYLLGPVEIIRDGQPCTPGAAKQRALVAVLLLHANELVPVERLIDELWGVRPPRSALAALHGYVTAVRRALVPANDAAPAIRQRHPVLRTKSAGYVLHVEPEQLDVAQFRALARCGRAGLAQGTCEEAGGHFQRALALWRGPALADLTRNGALKHYALRLEEERLAVLQARIGVDICRGRSAEVVGELEELCARQPLSESTSQQLMLALYLAGRRAEALSIYTRTHRIMIDEAGIEPGPDLRAMQQAILGGWEPPRGAHVGHP